MSFPELLEAVQALPKGDKLTLLHTLLKDVTPDEAMIARYFPPGVVLHTGWQVTTDEAGMRVLEDILAGAKGPG